MDFEWDNAKHDISFEDAAKVFDDKEKYPWLPHESFRVAMKQRKRSLADKLSKPLMAQAWPVLTI